MQEIHADSKSKVLLSNALEVCKLCESINALGVCKHVAFFVNHKYSVYYEKNTHTHTYVLFIALNLSKKLKTVLWIKIK